MRVGSFVYATDQGLGILARDFYDNGIITDVMPIMHGHRPNHDEWYPKAQWIGDLRSGEQRGWMQKFCEQMDVMLFFETPFWWPVISYCKAVGVKTVLMPMYECMPKSLPSVPDLFLNPSLLDQHHYPTGRFLPVPVDPSTWRLRTKAEVFVHNAGHGGLKGRNGTAELIEAMDYVKSPVKLLLRAQGHNSLGGVGSSDKIEVRFGTVPREELYRTGDVFVFPEKFNGLSLPLQEARAAGMLVMGVDRFPMNDWLPREPLIKSAGYSLTSIGKGTNTIREEMVDPRDIAAKIDEWYGRDITEYSKLGREWAQRNSWESLKPLYIEMLEGLCRTT